MEGKFSKLTLEDYEEFLANPMHTKLTKALLNQIVGMHGFRKLHRTPRNEIINALSSIDLMSPLRSTLKDNISSAAFLTTREVNEDLAVLGWQECPVQSIEALKQHEENTLNDYYPLLSADSSSDLNNAKIPRSVKKRSICEKKGKKQRTYKETDSTSASDLPALPSGPSNRLCS